MPTSNDCGDSFALRQHTNESSSLLFQSISRADWQAQKSEVRVDQETTNPGCGYIEVPDLPGTLKNLALKIDLDKDGIVSTAEMVSAIQDESITGKEAQALAALYRNKWSIAKLSNDQDSDMSGVSLNDIETLEKAMPNCASERKAIADAKGWIYGDRKFSDADSNHDGRLALEELDNALQQPHSAIDESGMSYIRKAMGDKANGISEADLRMMLIGSERFAATVDNVASESQIAIARTHDSQQPEVSKRLFANSDDPVQSIRPDAIKQGMVGNCYFAAALASVAATNPASIARMITDLGGGLYSVKFPAVDYPVMVSGPTETEMGLFNGGSKDGIWACVLEKAFGAYKICEERGPTYFGTNAEGADGGGDPSSALKVLTGAKSRDVYVGSEEAVRAALSEAVELRRAITTHTPNWGPGIQTTLDGFPLHHAYSILDFDADGPDGGTITLRNPWAGRDGTPEGLMKISVQKLCCQFVRLSIQGQADEQCSF